MYKLAETIDIHGFRDLIPRLSDKILPIIASSVDVYYPGIGTSLYMLKEHKYVSSGWEKRTLLCFAWCFGIRIPTEYAIHYGTRSSDQIRELYGEKKVRGIDITRMLLHQPHWTHKQWHERLDRGETIYYSEDLDVSWIRGVPTCVDLAERYIWATIQPYVDRQLTYSIAEYYNTSRNITHEQQQRAGMWITRAPSMSKYSTTTNINEILHLARTELALSCICVRCASAMSAMNSSIERILHDCVCCREVVIRMGNAGTHPKHAISKLRCETMNEWEQRCKLFADTYIIMGCVFYSREVIATNYV